MLLLKVFELFVNNIRLIFIRINNSSVAGMKVSGATLINLSRVCWVCWSRRRRNWNRKEKWEERALWKF